MPSGHDLSSATASSGIAVFDIGGTRFRRAFSRNDLTITNRVEFASPSVLTHPMLSADALRQLLVARIITSTNEIQSEIGSSIQFASISLGACLNGNSGEIYGSGPLWGGDTQPFRLDLALKAAMPEVEWNILNDVTAATIHAAEHANVAGARKVMLISIGSGIAARTISIFDGCIPLDDLFGIQGEIGHLPANVYFDGHPLNILCDCGKSDHVASYASGNGIRRAVALIARLKPEIIQTFHTETDQSSEPPTDPTDAFYQAARHSNSGVAAKIMSKLLTPLAQTIRLAVCLDPHIDKIVLRGGVVDKQPKVVVEQLLGQLDGCDSLYVIGASDPNYFRERILYFSERESDGLFGAALHGRRRIAAIEA